MPPHFDNTYAISAAAAEASRGELQPRAARAVVLVVDDEPDTVDILHWLLHREGYDVRTAKSGREALRSVEECVPDIAIVDYMMPGMNGIVLCKRLREQPATRQLPIILHTAVQRLALDTAECIDRVVPKPTEFDELLYEVRALLHRPH